MKKTLEKVICPDDMAAWLRQRGAAGPVAVVTGTYDIFQPGNLYALECAREVASTVLVLLETDEQAARHVSAGRPQNRLDIRVEMVAGLRGVDGVSWGKAPAGCFEGVASVIRVVGRSQRAGDGYRGSQEGAVQEVIEVEDLKGCYTEEIVRSIRDHQTPIHVPRFAYDELVGGPLPRVTGRRVTVNGCFDVLHVGHLRFLEQARALGDSLTVLINSDSSVARYKGATRPVFPAVFRVAALRDLSVVDDVVVFEEDNPLDVLGKVRPEVHVKGGSFEPERVRQERELVESWGGQLLGTPLVEGYSTSNFIRKAIGG